ncbi:MAG: hypothetical protein PVI86_13975 [Phycisphaerae bacterium]|jgi:hypothetical protein
MGRLGQGRGGLAPEQQTAINFKTERGKVHTGQGAIIGQFLVDGEQVKGDVSSDFTELVAAAERDATDRVKRNRVPRQYHKAVKAYFSNVQRSLKEKDGPGTGSSRPNDRATGGAADQSGDANTDGGD